MARIQIAGGSLGGLMAAILLARAGHAVQVFERTPGLLDGRGAGIVSHEALVRGLRRCGLPPDAPLGVTVDSRVVLGSDGSVISSLHMRQTLTSWARLYQLLHHLLQQVAPDALRSGVAVQGVSDANGGTPRRVTLHTTAGDVEGDLVVGADGLRSTIRNQVWPSVQPVYAGYVAWRGLCDEAALSDGTRAQIFERFSFGLPADEQFLGYPVASANPRAELGSRAWNFVWYRPAPSPGRLEARLTDADGRLHAGGIPPNRVSWERVADMREDGRRLLAPAFAEVIQKASQPFLQPIHDLCSDAIVRGRVALMGDAAFVARPHVGMGVTKAMDDASALADAVAAHGATPQALHAYQAQRLPAGQAIVARARWLGRHLEASATACPDESRRDAEAVLSETAIDLERVPTRFKMIQTAGADRTTALSPLPQT